MSDIEDMRIDLAELVSAQSDEQDAIIDLQNESDTVYEHETSADEVQDHDAAIMRDAETAEVTEQTADTQDVEADHLYDAIANQLGMQPTTPASAIENEDARESDKEPADVLKQIVDEITTRAERGDQSEIEKRLTMIVRSIEILKWARTAEECKDAVDELRENLEALFREQEYVDDAERLALELLNEYHIRTIDETMSGALKNIRSMRSYSPRFGAIRHLSIGRHVVRLLFGANPGIATASVTAN